MASTTIQYEAVKDAVADIVARSDSMSSLFDDFRGAMSRIYQDDVFYGEASESFNDKFNKLKTKFDAYVENVKDFAAIIEKARSETEATEQSIAHAAEDLGE